VSAVTTPEKDSNASERLQMGKAGLTYSNPMMDYRMKQSLVYVLCSLILAAGFVLGMSMLRYHVECNGESQVPVYKVDRMTGQVWRYTNGEWFSVR
jgi:hypothetical protein